MALKLDMSKAYDHIELGYLKVVMNRMGFAEKWISLVMHCVSSVSYSIIHGNQTIEPILPSRGIRQGDLLSTYLFIICAEGFSSLIQKFKDNRILQASLGAAESVLTLLHTYEEASGQKVNVSKSSVFFSTSVEAALRAQICTNLGMAEALDGSLYLGLPNIVGRNKNVILGFIKNNIINQINRWEALVSALDYRLYFCDYRRDVGNAIRVMTSLMYKLNQIFVKRGKFRLTIFPGSVDHAFVVALIVIFLHG
uniref:Reverse transcriptase domain-containing protein n=1 Tax=Cannabis sativa TaxID=3483 RepID=A0A803PV45_CANSA